jgi:hypothetical protein
MLIDTINTFHEHVSSIKYSTALNIIFILLSAKFANMTSQIRTVAIFLIVYLKYLIQYLYIYV